jgi:hypothetical protein
VNQPNVFACRPKDLSRLPDVGIPFPPLPEGTIEKLCPGCNEIMLMGPRQVTAFEMFQILHATDPAVEPAPVAICFVCMIEVAKRSPYWANQIDRAHILENMP